MKKPSENSSEAPVSNVLDGSPDEPITAGRLRAALALVADDVPVTLAVCGKNDYMEAFLESATIVMHYNSVYLFGRETNEEEDDDDDDEDDEDVSDRIPILDMTKIDGVYQCAVAEKPEYSDEEADAA